MTKFAIMLSVLVAGNIVSASDHKDHENKEEVATEEENKGSHEAHDGHKK